MMPFRNFRYNRQLRKCAEAGIKIYFNGELVGISELDKQYQNERDTALNALEACTQAINGSESTIMNANSARAEIRHNCKLKVVGAIFNKNYREHGKTIRRTSKFIAQQYKILKRKIKDAKHATAALKKFEKKVVKIGREKRNEIKLINYFIKYERDFERGCSESVMSEIKNCVKGMQEEGVITDGNNQPRNLLTQLKEIRRRIRHGEIVQDSDFKSPFSPPADQGDGKTTNPSKDFRNRQRQRKDANPGKDDPGKDDPGKDGPGKDGPGKDDPGEGPEL